MKIVQPIIKETDCECPIDTYLIYLDFYGVTGMECPKHGMLNEVDHIEFDSIEEWERWRNETNSSA